MNAAVRVSDQPHVAVATPPGRSAIDADDLMIVNAARCLGELAAAGRAVCFVGIGLPSTAANLARRLYQPAPVLVYESGCIGSKPTRLPLSIGDGELAETADAVVSVPEMFAYWLQAGRIDVGFLGGAQLEGPRWSSPTWVCCNPTRSRVSW